MRPVFPKATGTFIMKRPRQQIRPSRLSTACCSTTRKSTSGLMSLARFASSCALYVSLSISTHSFFPQERQSKIDEMKAQFTNLYIKNLDPETSQGEFEDLFKQFGNVTSAIISFDEEGRNKGFGFVNYQRHEEAQRAVDTLHDSEHRGKKLFVARAQKKAEREDELRRSYENAKMEKLSKYQGVNLYIKNLDDDVDDDKLRADFEPYGTITSAKIMRDEKGTSKGFGFVCFSSPDEATKAVSEMNGKMIGSKPLYVSLAQRRDVRKQQLESQMHQRNQIRAQQAAAAGIPGAGFMNAPPIYYGPGPGGFPPQGRGGVMGYPQPGMMPPRPRYAPGAQQIAGMPIPAPYGQPPQGYGSIPANYPPRGGVQPRPPNVPSNTRGAGTSPTNTAPRGVPTGPPAPNGAVPRQGQTVPPGGIPSTRAPPAGAPAAGRPQAFKRQGPPAPSVPASALSTEVPSLTPAALAAASPMEQKQMLGEVIYMKIAKYVARLAWFAVSAMLTVIFFSAQPDLAGKITGMICFREIVPAC